jgi:pyruvate carboxylase
MAFDKSAADVERSTKTNIPFLRSMLASNVFEQGGHHTTFAEGFASQPKTSTSSFGAT